MRLRVPRLVRAYAAYGLALVAVGLSHIMLWLVRDIARSYRL